MAGQRIARFAKYIVEKVSRAYAGKKSRPDVFISATSADLGTVRKLVRDALLDSDCFPVEQSHFAPDYRKVEEMLRAKISTCQAMIHIVGMRYGFEPNPAHRPPNTPRRSYTQMEYHIAKELGLQCYTFICPEEFPYDKGRGPEPPELQKLQLAHRQQFFQKEDVFTEFSDRFQLEKGVLKLQKDLYELRACIGKNSPKIWIAVFVNWLILITIVGGLWWGVNRLGASTDSIIRELRDSSASEKLHTQAAADSIIQELRKDEAPERVRAQAAALFDGRDYSGAFHAYAQLSDADPENLDLHRRIEECARLDEKLRRPFLDRYAALVRQHPANAIFQNYLGNARLLIDPEDRKGAARACYEAALRLDPQLISATHNLGVLLFRAGELDEAQKRFESYLSVLPEDPHAWVNLGLLYLARVQADTNDARSIKASADALERAIQIQPGSFSAYRALGGLFLAIGQDDEALHAYQESLALNPQQPDVRRVLADRFADAQTTDRPAAQSVTRSGESGALVEQK
ncbi:MAG: DUF4062 domain-containing protein [Phycisphaerae bacterium]|nr:DUF4062 domain-containing protein [Phycisphaerae bacterium]